MTDVIERWRATWSAFEKADDYRPADVGNLGDAGDALAAEVERLREKVRRVEEYVVLRARVQKWIDEH